jgi:hypothetical protein
MATFNLIINKIANLDNNIFSYNYETDNVDGMNKIFFNLLNILELKIYNNKFKLLNEITDNFYFSTKSMERSEFLNLFNKIQKTYHTLNRFVYLYKVKKSKLIVDIDMQLNKIHIGDPNVICIYHVNSKYLFKIDDLLKMIYMSLTNCFSFFAEPISIKNPYNNISFGKSILYYIYSYLISSAKIKYIKPEYLDIFFKFKESNFDMTKFVNSYEYILREYSIKNYLNNTTKTVILEQIFRMIDIYNSTVFRLNKKILIDPEFPDEELITIMKPYLYLSLESNYSLVVKNKTDAKKKLIIKLKAFQSFNPNFGRRIIKFKDIVHKEKIKRVRSHIGFNMKYRPFNSYNIDNFMNNHLRYKYEQDEGSNDNNDNDNDNDDDSDELEHRNMLNSIRYYLNTQILNNNTREEEGDPNYNEDEEDDQDNQEDEEDNQDNNQDNQEDSELSEEEYNDSVS